MAERRMFSKSIVDSDKFLDMPSSAQNLYFHLGMRADDEGFVNNPKKIQKIIGASDDDVKILLAKKYLILFESGVIVVTHWKIHNYIQKDRFKPTNAISEKALISLDTSNVYTLDTKCIQDVSSLDTQVRLGKVSLGKDKLSPKSSLIKDELEIRSEFIDDELIKLFIAHRKEIKHPMTQQALNLFVKKLEKLSEKDDPEELVNEAIINGWRSIFPKKENNRQTKSYLNPTSATIRNTFAKLEKLQKEKQNYIEGEIQ